MARKSSPKQLHLQARRAFVLSKRKAGETFRAISEAVRESFAKDPHLPKNYDHSAAWTDTQTVLDEVWESAAEDARDVLMLELMRLDDMMLGLWKRAASGDEDAVEQVLKIMVRRDAYMGLSDYGPRYFAERMGDGERSDRNAIEGIYKVVKVTKSHDSLEVNEDAESPE